MPSKKIFRAAVGAVVLLFVLSLAKDVLFQITLSHVLSGALGAKVRIGRAKLGLVTGIVRLEDIRVLQPRGFGKGNLVQAPLVEAQLRPGDLLTGAFHFSRLVVRVREVVFVRSRAGTLNVDTLSVLKKKEDGGKKTQFSSQVRFRADFVSLAFGRIVTVDHSRGQKPVVEAVNMEMKALEYRDIGSLEQLGGLILLQSLETAAVKSAVIYGTSALLGVSILPVGTALLLGSKSGSEEEFRASYAKVYDACLRAASKLGEGMVQDPQAGQIRAAIAGTDTRMDIRQTGQALTRVLVSSKHMLFPKPKIAEGVLYEIEQEL